MEPQNKEQYMGFYRGGGTAGMGMLQSTPTKQEPVTINVNVNDGAVQGLVEATVDQREGVRMESFKNNTTK